MRSIRLFVYFLAHLLGAGNPQPQSLTAIEEFLIKHEADLSTAFVIDSTAFQQMARETFTLPLLQVYDSTGEKILQVTGWRSGLADSIRAGLPVARPQEDDRPKLWDELVKFRTLEDEIVRREDLPSASYYFVEYWATWCFPCRYQMEDIHALVNTIENVAICVITVNCDLRESSDAKEHVADNTVYATESGYIH